MQSFHMILTFQDCERTTFHCQAETWEQAEAKANFKFPNIVEIKNITDLTIDEAANLMNGCEDPEMIEALNNL